ncbi:hypothetical protein SCATT_56470 [Streptantibioticus cattleyicolor NRRL 8057 = DSM 46488]|uniref:Uncharacterized protein n=1 Tax=Streptantibioticus cattleyicolor (strain ATCC 35852 / DSM 46488 / JCM 4925 / NBRC 14057 / NRRL 8057) TaxID=1003195 RepID=G8X423_STREN|nr:hypothetical protein SCATT_56470 [Streptantibioticus cattleyicolor NRRL 8057 = DSM 46488]
MLAGSEVGPHVVELTARLSPVVTAGSVLTATERTVPAVPLVLTLAASGQAACSRIAAWCT